MITGRDVIAMAQNATDSTAKFGRGSWTKGQHEGRAAWIHADFIVYRAAVTGNPWVACTIDGKHFGPWCRSATTAQALCQAYAEGRQGV